MLITNGKIITWGHENQILEGKALLIDGGIIREIGDQGEMLEKHPGEEIENAHSQYILPGLICAHTHFYGAFSRGMAIPGDPAADFPQILQKLWWPLDKSLNRESVRHSAEVCIIDAIKHGTTTLIDHHASPNFIEGSLDEIADVVDISGVRASLCYEVTDRDGLQKAEAGIKENRRFIDRVKRDHPSGGRLAATFGLHASLTLSDATLAACRNANLEDVGFHIHVAEHFSDEYDSLKKSNMRVVDRLYKHGILGPKSISVHAVHIDPQEMALLKDTQTWVTHQPRSNMNNAVGVADVEGMLRLGIKVCIGNDGFSNTMWEEWKTTYLVHKLKHLDPRRMNGIDIIKMGVTHNAELAGIQFEGQAIGMIEPGAKADLIFVDYHPFTPLTVGNLPWQILFGFYESMVTTTIVDGKVLMRDRKLITLDEEKIAVKSRKLAPEIWRQYNSHF